MSYFTFKHYLHFTGGVFQDRNNIKRPKLAETLEVIANHGSAGLHSGTIAESIVNTVSFASFISPYF